MVCWIVRGLMYLGEIPKNENVIIAFDIGDKHYDFTTGLLPDVDRKDREGTIFSEPIVIHGNILHLDERCRNLELRYLNRLSGRTHIWRRIALSYQSERGGYYVIACPSDSVQENRRRAVRVPINYKSECTMSLLEGKYPCTISDISVTGVGLNIDVELAEKNPIHRTVYTYFKDDVLGIVFRITAKCLYVSKLNARMMRCGCEIQSVTPSINEYINLRQTHRLAKMSAAEAEMLLKAEKGSERDGGEMTFPPEAEDSSLQRDPAGNGEQKVNSPEDGIAEGSLCPLCETGHLHFLDGGYECDVCGSILEGAEHLRKKPQMDRKEKDRKKKRFREGDFCPVCESGRLHFFEGGFECDRCGSILE